MDQSVMLKADRRSPSRRYKRRYRNMPPPFKRAMPSLPRMDDWEQGERDTWGWKHGTA